MANKRIFSKDWPAYELIDAGDGKKLERWGEIITIRPEVQAYFRPGKRLQDWHEMAHIEFIAHSKNSGEWQHKKVFPTHWEVDFEKARFKIEPTKFKHLGLFPEQRTNWDFITTFLKGRTDSSVLNLFAYTGAVSVVARLTGASVTHVDAVKQVITWARENMELSGVEDIRWICEDALKFAQKEVKRKKLYDLIVMDPPAYGIGAKNERWKIEQKLPYLILLAKQLLKRGGWLIINTYSPKIDITTLQQLAHEHFLDYELCELWKKTSTGKALFYGNLLRAKR